MVGEADSAVASGTVDGELEGVGPRVVARDIEIRQLLVSLSGFQCGRDDSGLTEDRFDDPGPIGLGTHAIDEEAACDALKSRGVEILTTFRIGLVYESHVSSDEMRCGGLVNSWCVSRAYRSRVGSTRA